MAKLNFDDLPDAGDRFILEDCVGTGVCGKVYCAIDTESSGKKVAIKMQNLNRENIPYIQEEYRILRELSNHPNLPEFYGVYRKVGEIDDEIWFSIELCEGGSVMDLVNALITNNRRMSEEHIAFIVKEVVKALAHLHQNHVIHRDVRGNNILLTKDGEVKLVDFGLCRRLSSTLGKSSTCIGSPCWMAPEVVASSRNNDDDDGYGNRADVWAIGITTIELGDGKAPFEDMHPTRALFQIVRNPPPTFYRPANWGETINDFINECLVKNPEHRPFMAELLEHPFLADVPENNYHLTQELKALSSNFNQKHKSTKNSESLVNVNFLKKNLNEPSERMNVEDLAALDRLSEDIILQELHARLKKGQFHTFIGDVLLVLNPNERQDIYNDEFHKKYQCKSRSDNAPHIYSVADSAYQDALHHVVPQNIIIAGESGSGKTTNFLHLIDHLIYLSQNFNINTKRIQDSIKLLHAFTHASTPINDNSTRSVFKIELTFGNTGKISGSIFNIHQLDKWRVSTVDMSQANYHIFYYFYDGMKASSKLEKYELKSDRSYRYLRVTEENYNNRPRDNIDGNVVKFKQIMEIMHSLDMKEEEIESILSVLSAILNLGDVRFTDLSQGVAGIENEECALKVARLLKIDDKKFIWSLTNYCLLSQGSAVRRRHTADEARDARDSFANTLFCRLLDYIVNVVNHKLSYGRAIFGEKYSIKLFDLFGFECFKKNHLPQLFINTLNEQLQYHYLQRLFAWEALEMNQEDIPFTPLQYYDNKTTLDQILGKPEGVITLVDDASRMGHGGQYIIDYIENDKKENVSVINGMEFSIAHYTGKVSYDAKEMPDRNRDFVPPEIIETLRLSKNPIVKSFFTNKLSKMGNLYVSFDEESKKTKRRLKASSSSSEEDNQSCSTTEGQYSQIKKMRTASSVFRSLCLEILKDLSIGGGAGGTQFVRCIRTDLNGKPKGFHPDMVKQQLRALAVVETAKARQRGYPYRIPFNEFLRRYKFLAFDFDENVEITKDNCRLLLVRLKMEGWAIGKSKVFLKYYNEEYLARLYETQVKKIIKIQSMMRAFLAKRKMSKKQNRTQPTANKKQKSNDDELTEDEAAVILQKAYRGVACRKAYPAIVKTQYTRLDEETCRFIKLFAKKWKAKSIFQILLQYRAARYYDMFSLSQQVHLYNQNVVHLLQKANNNIGTDSINPRAQPNAWLGERKPIIFKLPFRLDDVPYFDTSYLCDPLTNPGVSIEQDEEWDSPLQWRDNVSSQITASLMVKEPPKITPVYTSCNKTIQSGLYQKRKEKLIHLPYTRDPDEPIRRLSSITVDSDYDRHERKSEFQTSKYLSNTERETDFCYKCANKPYQQQEPIVRHRDYNYSSPIRFQESSYTESHHTRNSSFNENLQNGLNISPGKLNNFSKPANNDFEYIKPSPINTKNLKQISSNPIAEMQNLAKRSGVDNDDDPPFNFQGILRKTNIKRDSMKRSSIKNKFQSMDYVKLGYLNKSGSLKKFESMELKKTEVAPGIYMEGKVIDL